MEPEPENCPGIESENAGKSSACQGCPNQSICSSNEAIKMKEHFQIEVDEITKILKTIKHIILVMSGKGGVGKSTIAANLARSFTHFYSLNVGVLDLDLCGPSIPCILGAYGDIHQSGTGYCPILNNDGISVISTEFLLNSKNDAIIWRGPKKNSLIKKLLLNVDWGEELDILIIDTPPGTSDEHITLSQYLSKLTNVTAIVVSTPQEISLQDVRKEINFLNKVNIKISCICENMSFYKCYNCKNDIKIFPTSDNTLINKYKHFEFSFDPSIAQSADNGSNIFENGQSQCINQYHNLAQFYVDNLA